MRDHSAISASVRPHPMHTLCASSWQTLTQGDSTRGSEAEIGVMSFERALNYGDGSPILQTFFPYRLYALARSTRKRN